MPIKDQEHFKPEEPKPVYRETKGFKYQIFSDHIRFLFEDKEIRVPLFSLRNILKNVGFYLEDGYYTGQCIDCHKFDGLVNGYCKPCFDKNGLEYEDIAK